MSTNISIVMTVISEDRPGLVESIASTITELGGNWLESRMTRLGGQFAGILRVELPKDKEDRFQVSVKKLQAQGLQIIIQQDKSSISSPDSSEMTLEIVGQDRPGIVRQISSALAKYGVNVEDLHTETTSAPMSGDILFHATAEIRIPSKCPTKELRKELEKIASDLMVDFSLSEKAVNS